MKAKITLKDIARELEVSISTVSKALKNSEEISRDTKEKVQAFAKLYNYKPNNIAISLKNKRTKNIGVVVPAIVHHFFTTVIRGIEKYANAKGYNVIVCLSEESFDREVINMEMLANGSIDGFIMSLSSETQRKGDYNHLKGSYRTGIPLVLWTVSPMRWTDKVVIDDELGVYTKKLIEPRAKKKNSPDPRRLPQCKQARTEGYKKALWRKQNGILMSQGSSNCSHHGNG
ncbi:MAG: LacI family DNA-binding transcriptional regulator [Allomuricauda sp.]